MEIIDSHCHFGTGDGLTGPWDTRGDLSSYLPRAREAGIAKTVLIPVFGSDYRKANLQVSGLVRRFPRRFHYLAMVHPRRDRGRILATVLEANRSYGCCGIKVHRHDGHITREICNCARKLSLPILYDVMDRVDTIELIATEYPDVNFIIPHLGSFGDNWSAQRSFIDILERHDNVYTDSSGVRRFDLLQEAVERCGPHKLLFGSDGPWLHPGVELEKIYSLRLQPAAERLVLGGNFLRLIHSQRPQR